LSDAINFNNEEMFVSLNKPDYSLFKNTRYALQGLYEVFKNEQSFRMQLLFFLFASVIAWILPFSYVQRSILFISLFLPVITEIINSAIERSVDLITQEHHELAKRAKDAGAAIVFVSFVTVAFVWFLVIFYSYMS